MFTDILAILPATGLHSAIRMTLRVILAILPAAGLHSAIRMTLWLIFSILPAAGLHLWHMPHGVFLHAAPNSNNYSLLYKSSTSSTPPRTILRCNHPLVLFSDLCALTKSIRCNSYSLRTADFLLLGKPPENSGTNCQARNQPSHKNSIANTQCTSPKVLAPNLGCSTIHWRSEGTNDSSGASSDHDRDALLTTSVLLTSQLSGKPSSWTLQYFLMHIKSPWNSDESFITEMEFWLLIALATLSAPHQRCQHHIQSAQLIKKNCGQTNATSGASSYHGWWCTSRDLRAFTMSFLIGLLGITILQSLSPSNLDMPIYLINQMAFLHPTSNNTICNSTFMCPSKLFSSPISSWLWHPRSQEATTIRARLFSIASASALTTPPPLQASTSPLSAPGCSMPRWQELVSEFPHSCVPRDCELLLRKSACPATNVPTKKDAGCYFASPPCTCLHRNFHCLQLLHRILWCSFLLLWAWTAIWYHTSSRDWTPLCYGWHYSMWRKSLLNLARSCHLVPLY